MHPQLQNNAGGTVQGQRGGGGIVPHQQPVTRPQATVQQVTSVAPTPAEKRVFISNIPLETKWQDVKDLFKKEIGPVRYVNLFKDGENQVPCPK